MCDLECPISRILTVFDISPHCTSYREDQIKVIIQSRAHVLASGLPRGPSGFDVSTVILSTIDSDCVGDLPAKLPIAL